MTDIKWKSLIIEHIIEYIFTFVQIDENYLSVSFCHCKFNISEKQWKTFLQHRKKNQVHNSSTFLKRYAFPVHFPVPFFFSSTFKYIPVFPVRVATLLRVQNYTLYQCSAFFDENSNLREDIFSNFSIDIFLSIF